MKKHIEVVDDFYRDAMAVRADVLARAHWTSQNENGSCYHETRTRESFGDDEADGKLAGILGPNVAADRTATGSGYCAFVGEGAHDRLAAHVDDVDWVAFVYLSLPDQCSGGISFYRDGTADPAEDTMHIPMQFNRMVAFRASQLFHRVSCGFGASPGSGYLAQVFRFTDTLS